MRLNTPLPAGGRDTPLIAGVVFSISFAGCMVPMPVPIGMVDPVAADGTPRLWAMGIGREDPSLIEVPIPIPGAAPDGCRAGMPENRHFINTTMLPYSVLTMKSRSVIPGVKTMDK